jgi:hypothetical protein
MVDTSIAAMGYPVFTLDNVLNGNGKLADEHIAQLSDFNTHIDNVLGTDSNGNESKTVYDLSHYGKRKGVPSRFMRWLIEWNLEESFPFVMKRYNPGDGRIYRENGQPYNDGEELASVKGALFALDGFGITKKLVESGVIHPRDVPQELDVFHDKDEFLGYLKRMKREGKEDGAHIVGYHPVNNIGRVGLVTELIRNGHNIDHDRHMPADFLLRMPFDDSKENNDYLFHKSGNRTRAAVRNAIGNVHTYLVKASAYGIGGKIAHFHDHDLVEEYFQASNLDRDPLPSIHPEHPIVGVYRAYDRVHGKLALLSQSFLGYTCPSEMFR